MRFVSNKQIRNTQQMEVIAETLRDGDLAEHSFLLDPTNGALFRETSVFSESDPEERSGYEIKEIGADELPKLGLYCDEKTEPWLRKLGLIEQPAVA